MRQEGGGESIYYSLLQVQSVKGCLATASRESPRDCVGLCCVVQLAEKLKGCWWQGRQRSGDVLVPCKFENRQEDDWHDRHPNNSVQEKRDYFREWFNGNGAIAWQDDKL